MTHTTLGDLAQLVGGSLRGEAATPICGASILRDVEPGEITLVDRPEFARQLAASDAAAAVVSAGVDTGRLPAIEVDDVHRAFAQVVRHFRPERASAFPGVSAAAHIDPSASLAADVQIHPGAVIGAEVQVAAGTVIHSGAVLMAGCRIGRHATIFPAAVLYEETVVGDHAIIHAGAVLGAYGFGYDTREGRHHLSAQLGNVVLEDHVEIGAGTTIDRGTYGPTVIGEGTKIDDQVQIAHNCRIGRHNMICSQVGIAGSATTGDYVVLAGQVGIRDHVHIGDGAVLGAKAGIMTDISPGSRMLGIPATPERVQMQLVASLHKLPDLRKQVKKLEQQLALLLQERESRRGEAA